MIAATEYPTKMTMKVPWLSNKSDGRLKSFAVCDEVVNSLRWDGKLPLKKLHLLETLMESARMIGWLLSLKIDWPPQKLGCIEPRVDKTFWLTDHG